MTIRTIEITSVSLISMSFFFSSCPCSCTCSPLPPRPCPPSSFSLFSSSFPFSFYPSSFSPFFFFFFFCIIQTFQTTVLVILGHISVTKRAYMYPPFHLLTEVSIWCSSKLLKQIVLSKSSFIFCLLSIEVSASDYLSCLSQSLSSSANIAFSLFFSYLLLFLWFLIPCFFVSLLSLFMFYLFLLRFYLHLS